MDKVVATTQPTKEQQREFWEWCGFSIGNYPEPKLEPNEKAWFAPNGQFFCGIPNMILIDLNNLFKYAAPRFKRQVSLSWNVWDKWKGEVQLEDGHWVHATDEDPALALFWALWKVIKEDNE